MREQEKHILLQKLQQGTISPAEYRTLELLALDDDFLFEALEGYQTNSHQIQDIAELKNRVQLRTQKEAKRRALWIPVSAIAATLVGFLFLSWWMFQTDPIQNFADSNEKSSEVSAIEETSMAPMQEDGFEGENMESEELDRENEPLAGNMNRDIHTNTRQSKPSSAQKEMEKLEDASDEILNDEAEDIDLEMYAGDSKDNTPPQEQAPVQPNVEAINPNPANIPVEASESAIGQVMQKSESTASPKKENKQKSSDSSVKIVNAENEAAVSRMRSPIDGLAIDTILKIQVEPIMGFEQLKLFIHDNSPLESRGNYVIFEFQVDQDGQIQDLKPIRYSSEKWIKLATEIMLASGQWKVASEDSNQVVFFKFDF